MELESSSETRTQEAPEERVSHKKPARKKIVIGILVGLFILIPVVVFLFRSKPEVIPTPEETSTQAPIELNFDVVQTNREVVSYIDSQLTDNGYYNYYAHYDEICGLDGYCPFGDHDVYETTNTWAALGHFAAYKISGDESELGKAKEDIYDMESWCALDRQECLWVLFQPEIINENSPDERIREFLLVQGPVLLANESSGSAMLSAIETRELAKLYSLTQDPIYLNAAQQRLDKTNRELGVAENVYTGTNKRFAKGSCWMTLANIDLIQTTGGDYSNIAAFLNNGDIRENFSVIDTPIDIQPCIESYIRLYEVTGDHDHLYTARQLMNMFMDKFYDGPTAPKVYGEGGTLFSPRGIEEGAERLVTLTDSAYTLYLLSLFNDYQEL